MSVIEANASGNPVHSTTRAKISHTWLASHTGPTEWSMTRPGPGAPLRSPGDEVPEPGAEVGAAEDGVGGHRDEQHDGDGVSHRRALLPPSCSGRGSLRAVRDVAVDQLGLAPEPPAHAPEHEDDGRREREVDHDDDDERDPDALVAGGRVLDLHVPADDPGLAAHLGDHPPRLHRQDRGDTGHGGDPEEQLRSRHVAPEDPGEPVPGGQQEQQRAEPDHHVPGQVDGVDLAGRRSLVGGERVETLHDRARAGARVRQPRGEARGSRSRR